MIACHVKRVRDVQVPLKVHDVERCKAWRQVRIHEAARNGRRLEGGVEYVDLAVEEVGGEQPEILVAVSGDGDALVDRVWTCSGGWDDCGRAAGCSPRGNCAVLGRPEEKR